MTAKVGSLNVDLTIETARFQNGLSNAGKQMQGFQGRMAGLSKQLTSFGAGFAVGAVTNGLSSLAANAFETASALSESAAQVGVSVEALQELRFAADQSGIGADKMDATIKRLNKSLGELQLGSKPAVEAFAAIGLSADDLRGKKPEEALRLIADALNKLPDAAQRVAIGQQLMGRSFSDLLPLINGGSAELDKYAEASRKNGQISTEDAARLDELADRWDELKTRTGVATANLIASGAKLAEQLGGALGRIGIDAKVFDQSVYSAMTNAAEYVSKMVYGVGLSIGSKLREIWDAAIAKVKQFQTAVYNMYDAVVGHSYVPDMVDKIGAHVARLDGNMVKPIEAMTGRASAAFAKLGANGRNAFASMAPGQGMPGGLQAISGPSTAAEHAAGGNPIDQVTPKTEEWQERLSALQGTFSQLGGRFGELASSMVGAISGLINPAIDSSISKFQQMATAMQGITGLLQSIFGKKIGGIIGIGLQLFSAFGGGGGRIPGFANGTNFAPGGLAMVGERGPELVSLPRGSRVTPNNELSGLRGSNGGVMEIRPSPLFEVYVDGKLIQAAPAIANAGGQIGLNRMKYSSTRRVA